MSKAQEVLVGQYLKDRNAYICGGEPLVFHCHHYNIFLLESIENTRNIIDPYPILVDSAHSVVYSQLNFFKHQNNLTTEDVLELAKIIFKKYGFGLIEYESLDTKKGSVILPVEHYGIGWKSKYGERHPNTESIAFFARGFVEATIEVAYGLPFGSVASFQTHCIAKGDDYTRIEYLVNTENPRKIIESPKEGVFTPVKPLQQPENTSIDYIAVRDAVLGLPLMGNEEGLIPAFGVYLTRMYANYYNIQTYMLLQEITKVMGDDGLFLVETLLKEAGHVCAFNTLGGIMTSPEWDAVVRPQIKEHKDWVHGIVAVINALGWGVVEIKNLIEHEKLEISCYSDYENNGLIALKLQYNHPAMFLEQGINAGIMNLLYNQDITKKPALTPEFYKKVFVEGHPFVGYQTRDRRLDGEFSITESKRL